MVFEEYGFATIAFCCAGVLLSARSIGLFTYIQNISTKTDIFEKYYVFPDEVEICFPDEKRNLLLIYLESMESTYASVEAGGRQNG